MLDEIVAIYAIVEDLLKAIGILDGVEILIDIQTVNNFSTSLEDFRNSQDFKNADFEEEIFTNLRDKTTGRNVEL